MQGVSLVLLWLSCLAILTSTNSFMMNSYKNRPSTTLNMGLGDVFAKALANDPSLPPTQSAGLSGAREAVEVEFFPSGKKVKAYLGQDVSMIAKAAKVEIKYNCKKGNCGTCMINFEGKLVKACQSSLPIASKKKSFQIGIITKA
jgi:ferredoxin